MVGAVIVKDSQVIGQGYHTRCGDLHAERAALASCTESPKGATIYVTLEPCCHQGRQPPCTDALLEAGISRVVVGAPDPNPQVAGRGVAILREAGVTVTEHVLEAECIALNDIYFHYITTGTPYVILKYAMTLDGKIAAHTGQSQWITGEVVRHYVHTQRGRCRAIMVGVGTVLSDNPQLTCRIPGGRSPLRIVCDSHLRTHLADQVVQTDREVPTIIATCSRDQERIARYEDLGVLIWTLPARDGRVDLSSLMVLMGQNEIDSVLIEGGAALNWSLLECGLVHKVQAYISPKLLGGSAAKSPVGGQGFPHPNQAVRLRNAKLLQLGDDWLLESEVVP